MHEITESLGPLKSKALTVFHVFTCCGVVCFSSKQKSSALDTWVVYPVITGIFVELSSFPSEITQEQMNEIQQYVVLLYARGSELSKADEARKVGFTESGKQIEGLPTTLAALIEHAK